MKIRKSIENNLYSRRKKKFISTLINDKPDEIRGICSTKFMLRVAQQPSGQDNYVSSLAGYVTQFSMAKKYNVIGILAHNYFAGEKFFRLEIGNIIQTIYGDGLIGIYQVQTIDKYRALQPNSPRSNFEDWNTNKMLTATELFKLQYTGKHRLVLQVCIQEGKVMTAGRMFVTAKYLGGKK